MAETPEDFFCGLDLGQAADFTCLAALSRRAVTEFDRAKGRPVTEQRYVLRGLRRWHLGTLYTAIVDDVVGIVAASPLANCLLGADMTGCGKPVLDMLTRARPKARVRGVLITAGHKVTVDSGAFHVPKKDLVAALQSVLQGRRMEIPTSIPEHKTLTEELLAFRAKISAAGNEQFEADWRSRAHDDMVLAVAIAVWLAERSPAGQSSAMPTAHPLFRHDNIPPQMRALFRKRTTRR